MLIFQPCEGFTAPRVIFQPKKAFYGIGFARIGTFARVAEKFLFSTFLVFSGGQPCQPLEYVDSKLLVASLAETAVIP